MNPLTDKQLHDLAHLGAVARLKALDAEAAALRRLFPGLTKSAAPAAEPAASRPKPQRKRKKRSLAFRQAARARMKAYWEAKKRGGAPASDGGEKAQAAVADATASAAKPKKTATSKRKQRKAAGPRAVRRHKKA